MAQLFELDRNDKCPCGSGRKYKKCCMDRVEGQKRRILKAIGEGLAAQGMAAVHVLSVMLGLDLGNQMPEAEYLAKLMRQVWKEEEDEGLEEYMEAFQELLRQKPGLKLVRIPGDWLVDEKLEDEESMKSLRKQVCSRTFIEPLLLQIAKSIKSEEYSEKELKTLLWAISNAADENFAEVFIESVFNASMEEIIEARKKVKEWYEEHRFNYEFDNKELIQKIKELVQECPNFGCYMGEILGVKFGDEVKALIEEVEKIDVPLFAIYSGLVEFYIKLAEKMEETDSILDLQALKDYVSNILWEGNRSEYFLEGVQRWLAKEMLHALERAMSSDDKTEKKRGEDTYKKMADLAVFLLWPYTPFQLDSLGKIYASLILNFSKNIPRRMDDSDEVLNDISELFEKEFVEKYVKYLEDKGLKKAAGYVSGCFYRMQQILNEKGDEFKVKVREATRVYICK